MPTLDDPGGVFFLRQVVARHPFGGEGDVAHRGRRRRLLVVRGGFRISILARGRVKVLRGSFTVEDVVAVPAQAIGEVQQSGDDVSIPLDGHVTPLVLTVVQAVVEHKHRFTPDRVGLGQKLVANSIEDDL